MSLFAKVKMSPSKGQENGPTTEHERQRPESLRSDAKALRKTNAPKRSRSDAAPEYTPDQTVAEGLSPAGSRRAGVETPRQAGEQSLSRRGEETRLEFIEDQVQGVWSDAGPREAGGKRQAPTLG